MKKILLSALLLSAIWPALAQELLPCGTKPTQKQIERINARMRNRPANAKILAASVSNVAISAHILRTTDGTGGLTEEQLDDAMTTLNGFYTNANLSFFILGDINYIDDDQFYDYDSDDESTLGSANDVENTINIYFANSVTSGEDALCGYAYFSGGPDRILMDNSCAINGSTLPHEVGHFFDLYHTHGTTNNGTTDELVDGSNCTTAGDNICDTPADPNLSGVVDGSCNYTGTDTDANDDEFDPDTGNIMSYAPKACRTQFSDGQYSNIASTYADERNYLISKSLAANFDADLTTICTGSAVTFEDKSISATSWDWEFSGGTPATSDEQNPEVIYETAGTYTVVLTITNDDAETDAKTITEYIVVEDPNANPLGDIEIGFEVGEETLYSIENEDNDDTFEISSVSQSGDQSLLMDFLNYDQVGEEDYLILDDLDLSDHNLFRLSFDRAYAYYDDDYKDSLALVIAEACNYDWQLIQGYSAEELATADPHTVSFVPVASEWKNHQILIEFDDSWEAARFAFNAVNGYGNNLYLDQIILEPVDTDLEVQEIVVECSSGTADGSIEVLATASGDLTFSLDGDTYQSSTEFSALEAGDYVLYTKQDGNLVSMDEFTVATSATVNVTIATDENGDLTADSEATTFQWFYNDQEVVDGTSSSLELQGGGVYFVVVTNEAGCSAKSTALTITQVESMVNQAVYPNPVLSEINISLADPIFTAYEVADLTGKTMISGVLDPAKLQSIDASSLHPGIYVMRLNTKEGPFQIKFRKL
ncbi:MAG: PKD domain-containing protein [Reichenbachiella sp.]|uniref:PKD domain-containing protein n=1 Tax=Reichenbachiella sp. TaxID=2184521 RepID=UPI003267F999